MAIDWQGAAAGAAVGAIVGAALFRYYLLPQYRKGHPRTVPLNAGDAPVEIAPGETVNLAFPLPPLICKGMDLAEIMVEHARLLALQPKVPHDRPEWVAWDVERLGCELEMQEKRLAYEIARKEHGR